MTYSVCLMPGDGVGQEVIPAAAEVLRATGLPIEFVWADAGWACFERTRDALPPATVEAVQACRVALFGATQSPMSKVAGYRSPILALRKAFDLYANIRPTRSLPVPGTRQGLDFVIVRENTEGLYAGRERREGDTAIAERVITRRASERIVRVACELAVRRRTGDGGRKTEGGRRKAEGGSQAAASGKQQADDGHPSSIINHQSSVIGRLTLVHKANVLGVTDGLFREAGRGVTAEYPDLKVDELLVDAAAMWLVKAPERFDVLVTTNLFGDILSDLAAGLVGGLGVAPSANIGPQVAVFEPVHGSAPDIAGQGVANPVGAILSAAMLLDHLGEAQAAERVRQAVEATVAAGVCTPDLGGHAATREVTEAIIRRV